MEKHPIENIMSTTLENIRDMIDVNTVVGEPNPGPRAARSIPSPGAPARASPCSRWAFWSPGRTRPACCPPSASSPSIARWS